MKREESRKLLQAYANGALSADERSALLEAARKDRELSNAIQNEDAVRDLVADPVSRDQLRRALRIPSRAARRPGLGSRRWFFGVVLPSLAAALVVIMMTRANAPTYIKVEPSTAQAIPSEIRKQFATALDASFPLYEGPLVQYSMHRGGWAGEIRMDVVTELRAYLGLYEVEASGKWQRMYPVGEPALLLAAGQMAQIPIANTTKPLRLLVVPTADPKEPLAIDVGPHSH